MKINSETRLFGIIGYPIKHSLSPTLHSMLFKKYGLNFVYLAFEILPEKFNLIKDIILTLNIRGLNVTIPYKEKIIPYLDEIDKLARTIGSVNTIFNKDGKLIGYNTDIYGFTKSLKGVDIRDEEAILIGCGGVSNPIVVGLSELGVKKVYVYDIDSKKMLKLKENFGTFVIPLKKENLDKVIKDVKVVINATPLGMKEGDTTPINLEVLNKNHIVYDVIYNRETELVKHAKKIGCKNVFDGVEMFIYQAEQAFFIWTGIKPNTSFMMKLVCRLLNKKD